MTEMSIPLPISVDTICDIIISNKWELLKWVINNHPTYMSYVYENS